jgi:hypothetical protein
MYFYGSLLLSFSAPFIFNIFNRLAVVVLAAPIACSRFVIFYCWPPPAQCVFSSSVHLYFVDQLCFEKGFHCERMQKVITKFAVGLKKEAQFMSQGYFNAVIKDEHCLKVTDQFLKSVYEKLGADAIVDLKSVSAGWANASFMFGQDVNAAHAGGTPTSACMLRYQVMGDVDVYLLDLAKLNKERATAKSMAELKAFLLGGDLTEETLKSIVVEEAIVFAKCVADSLLYVPW